MGYQPIDEAIKVNNCRMFSVDKSEYDNRDFESENNAIAKKTIEALKIYNTNLVISTQHID
jgi:hypothetical protein